MAENLSEKELTKRIAQGDRDAFALMYKESIKNLYQYIYFISRSSELSEEIIQSVFVKIWETREKLVYVDALKPYLFRVAKNLLLNHIKKSQIESRVKQTIKPESEESSEKADTKVIYSQYVNLLQEALNKLPEKRRQIVELRTKDDLSLDEIAQKLNISKSVVKKQLYAGLHSVREYILQNGELAVGAFFIIHYLNKFS